MYSHDTFGLGHLRRCRTIAHSLVANISGLHVLIISGSPIAGAFDFRVRVDFVKVPSVIKLHSGEYKSMIEHIDLEETLEMRRSMIRDTARSFKPDILIVDKEPMGLQDELEGTLRELKKAGTTLVLGMRDVMDSGRMLEKEWQPKNMIAKIEELYDRIWVYGPESFWNPLSGLAVSDKLQEKITYTGFLRRTVPDSTYRHQPTQEDFILITTGGGGDGAALLKNVLSAYETDPAIPYGAVMVLGPFMPAAARDEIFDRAEKNGRITVIEFDALIEKLIVDSKAVVGMCGYNTFCEYMSFDKRTLFVPRVRPREEQLVRATRAAELGLAKMLRPEQAGDPKIMATALHDLVKADVPSSAGIDNMFGGLERIVGVVDGLFAEREKPRLSVIKGGAT
jgi:predicted glycosyltransferase